MDDSPVVLEVVTPLAQGIIYLLHCFWQPACSCGTMTIVYIHFGCLDSIRCVVHLGNNKFKKIQKASKNLKQDDYRKKMT